MMRHDANGRLFAGIFARRLGLPQKFLRTNSRTPVNLQSGFPAVHGGKAMPYREAGLLDFEAAPLNFSRRSLEKNPMKLPGKAEPFRRGLRQSR